MLFAAGAIAISWLPRLGQTNVLDIHNFSHLPLVFVSSSPIKLAGTDAKLRRRGRKLRGL